jgi:hypothetical protein
MPIWASKHDLFRKVNEIPSHLRTFYAWLFKKIKKELCYQGTFASMTGDIAMMLPMIKMTTIRLANTNYIRVFNSNLANISEASHHIFQ